MPNRKDLLIKKTREEALDERVKQGRTESIKGVLRVRFPESFTDNDPSRLPELYEKTLNVLDSLLPVSVSCASLSDFTQKL